LKIWIQSNTAVGFDKSWDAYEALERQHLDSVASPDTELRFSGVEKMEERVEHSPYARHLNVRQVISKGLEAQQEGYSAFVVAGLGVAGRDELNDLLTIPVVYAETVAWHWTAWLHGAFSVIGHDRIVYFRRVEQIRRAGLLGSFVPNAYSDMSVSEVRAGLEDPEPVLQKIRETSGRATFDGARALIPDFNVLNTLLVSNGIGTLHGVPVVDTSGMALKAAEMLVRSTGVNGLNQQLPGVTP
jgi:allantoin racemase